MLTFRKSSQVRIQRLQQDLAEMEKLCKLAPPSTIRFVAGGRDKDAPDNYIVEIGITSFTQINNNGIPMTCERFRMEIVLPRGYPRQLPECKVYPAPYHPHFRKIAPWMSDNYGIWVDPYGSDESLGSLVLRITRSLRFESAFIDINSRNIGNKDALEWYSSWQTFFQDPKIWFPSDKTILPETLVGTQKKFNVEAKQFNLADEPHSQSKESRFSLTSPKQKTFQIIESTLPYQPILVNALPDFGKLYKSDLRGSCKNYQLYIKPKAISKIFEHIVWDKKTTENKVEQGGILLGHAYRDEATNIIFGVIEDAIIGDLAIGTSAYLEMGHATWKKMIDEADVLLDAQPDENLQIMGWYHTHPNSLDVFMSGTDKGTQARVFSKNWQFAIVLNPHRKLWRAFHGKDAEECQGFIVKNPIVEN